MDITSDHFEFWISDWVDIECFSSSKRTHTSFDKNLTSGLFRQTDDNTQTQKQCIRTGKPYHEN